MFRLPYFSIKNKNISLDKLYEGFRKSLDIILLIYLREFRKIGIFLKSIIS